MHHDTASPPRDARKLNVIFIAGFDSTNYAYVELVHELCARGHRCTVIVEDERDVINNKMFGTAGIDTVLLSRFSAQDLDAVDFAVSGPYLRRQHRALFEAIYKRRIFLISFANLFSSVTMRVSPDLVITSSESKFEDFADNGLAYNMVAVGNPQYDPLIRARATHASREIEGIRKVLVVDQGAYPLGDVGKRQLATTLVKIASNNPEMSFHVKPRYLPKEDGEHLHSVSDHLYSYLTETPDNLVLVQEQTILEEMLLDFDAMITTWSTAHLDAVALDLPMLLIGGLDSVDVFDVRAQRVAAAYDHLRDSRCLVDWRDLQAGPCPFAYASDSYVRAEFYDITTPCAPRIVDLLQAIDADVLSQGRAFAGNFQLAYSDFMQQVATLETRDSASEDNRLNRRLADELNVYIQTLVFDHRYMGYAFEMSKMLPFWRTRVGVGATDRTVDSLVAEAREVGDGLKESFFAAHPEHVAGDPFVQDQYFDWLRRTGRLTELFGYSGPVLVPTGLEYNQGLASLRRGRVFRAARHVVESFSISLQAPCRVLKKDRDIRVLLSRTDLYLLAHAILLFLNHYRKYDALSVVDVPARRNLDAVVYYKMKALVAKGCPEDARSLYEEYLVATKHKAPPARGKGLERWALGFVVGAYRRLLRRYAAKLS